MPLILCNYSDALGFPWLSISFIAQVQSPLGLCSQQHVVGVRTPKGAAKFLDAGDDLLWSLTNSVVVELYNDCHRFVVADRPYVDGEPPKQPRPLGFSLLF
jgi:hypothetical protein